MRRTLVTAGSVVAVLAVVAALALHVSHPKRPRPHGPLTEAERAVIAAYTAGSISRESPIRVLFTEPRVEASQLGAPVEPSPFRFEPKIAGTAVWTSRNQIEFHPGDRLPDATSYAASLDLAQLLQDKAPLKSFDFTFATMSQSLDVDVDGLEAADASDIKRLKLTGKLVTADVDDAARVEKVLTAAHGGETLTIGWTHDANRRTHAFAVSGIVRAESTSSLRLSWDGLALGVAGQKTREIAVPGLNTFTVDQARAVQEPEQYVELRFTDPLKTPQNLAGLVQIPGREDLRFVISGSIVQVFGSKGFRGEQKLRVAAGIRNVLGFRMKEARELSVEFVQLKPQVRFAGRGVIVPTSTGLKIPIEAVNLRAVTVAAMRIPDGTLPQFLQVNRLDGESELNRVGRVVWEKTLPLEVTPERANRWMSIGLDLSPLVEQNPGGMYRLTLSFQRPHIVWSCPDAPAAPEETAARPADEEQEQSNWDYFEDYEGDWRDRYENRENPCNPGYYQRFYDHDVRASRNVLVSNLGLIAKMGEDDRLLLVATDLRTTAPAPGAAVTILDYQQQTLARGRTDSDGFATLPVEGKPFLAVVEGGGQRGYLRLDDGSALSTAHFDVAGGRAPKGLKGFLYGERGVWRPGDTLHLTFLLLDPAKRLQGDHPARLELVNSRGQVVKTITRASSTDGFYVFEIATAPDAPTGNYVGRVSVGGAIFEKTLKVETVMPNRLKIALDFGKDQLEAGAALAGTLHSAWLHGAPASALKADVELALEATRTSFPRYAEYVFDDPTVRYQTEKQKIFEGRLDESGSARISATLSTEKTAPGKLTANLTTRVFEPGGAFSIDRFTIPYSPYQRYVGIRTPRGDRTRGMLLTDVKHTLDVVTVDPQGQPTGSGEVELRLYKVNWRWWWEHGEEDLSAYAESKVNTPLQSGTVALTEGIGSWQFEVKYPEWGRYLVTATDSKSGHRTGRLLYIDWPNWAGRGQKELEGGASVLSFASDKPEYKVGETVTLVVPTPRKGRVLVSIESGSRVLATRWLDAQGSETRTTFQATREMAPNVYAHVTLLQPHAQTGNDLPIRMYGVVPIKVVDAETRLKPVLQCADVLQPESRGRLSVREASGRPMTYTVAVVDQGLLDLTRFATPNPWDSFYAREALAVRTWDVFDFVVGAYGAAMERMLAIGGDTEGQEGPKKRANRFPPMVRFLGPFRLAAGAVNTHTVDIPQYVGAVRVMVVAGRGGAYGATEKSVFVRRPLMLLGTLPRVLGPQEQVALPVSVFALEPQVKEVSVSVSTSGPLSVVGPSSRKLSFKTTGDELVSFRLGAKAATGVARAVIRAVSGTERAEQQIELDVRLSTQRAVDVIGAALKAGESWEPKVTLPGQAGTNAATLEVSRVPPLDLGRRLEYLIQYPHGCVEQTVSGAFPQLFLDKLLELSPERLGRVQSNVKAALDRLRGFQTSEGGFAYWPGGTDPDDWATNYAGHFIVEAQNAGYAVPPGLVDQWKTFQRRRARGWGGTSELEAHTQAYRLYTLALAQAPELPAMNQLRERGTLPVAAKWRLAVTYQLAGQPEAARALITSGPVAIKPYRELGGTYGSDLRDRAMVLEAIVGLNLPERVGPLAKSLSETLSKDQWLSTQETAYALLALARCASTGAGAGPTTFTYAWNDAAPVAVTSPAPLVERKLEAGDRGAARLAVRNTGNGVLYTRLVMSGLPAVGRESAASNGLTLEVSYSTPDGKPLDPSRLEQGTDLKVVAKVTNTGVRGRLEEVALSHLFPSGWEIRNERMELARHRPPAGIEYQDVRDDRVYTYFGLAPGATQAVEVLAHASYLGHFYLPQVSVEPMYDASLNARTKGQWVEVIEAGTK